MFFRKKRGQEVIAPMSGTVIALDEVNEPIFAGKVIGDGVAIIPDKGEVYAPISGVVSFVGDSKHSIGITGFDSVEVLIHIGIDTAKLDSSAFTVNVSKGQRVNVGDLICTFDLELLKKTHDVTSPVVISSLSMDKIKRLTLDTGKAEATKTACMEYLI